jgi:hypothetical protein
MEFCVYHEGEKRATHQCPKCRRGYCDECYELFLPIDSAFPSPTAMICSQCHYETYARLEGSCSLLR